MKAETQPLLSWNASRRDANTVTKHFGSQTSHLCDFPSCLHSIPTQVTPFFRTSCLHSFAQAVFSISNASLPLENSYLPRDPAQKCLPCFPSLSCCTQLISMQMAHMVYVCPYVAEALQGGDGALVISASLMLVHMRYQTNGC